METKKPLDKRYLAILIGGLVIICAVLCIVLLSRGQPEADDTPRVGYAVGATVATSSNELQEIADRAAQQQGVTLEYSNTAISQDGQTVACYVANAAENQYDMYFGVYLDPDYTDELYLSGLLRPGTALEEITFSRALDPGNYQIYVVETQVDEIDGRQTIVSQVSHTVELKVNE